MRTGNFNFAVAVIISLAAHALLWPASKRIMLPQDAVSASRSRHATQITMLLNAGAPRPLKPMLPRPKVPDVDSPEDMGEHGGKGTGAQAAKGETPLKAREADQDQAFLSRDPIGHGRVGDPPAFDTGIRGQNGHGGQAGSPMAGSAESATGDKAKPAGASASPPTPPAVTGAQPVAHRPDAIAPPAPPHVLPLAPPPSPVEKVGSAKASIEKPAVSEVKAADPLAKAPQVIDDAPLRAPLGPSVLPVEPSGTAPPVIKSARDHPSVALAMAMPLQPAPVIPPPPQQKDAPNIKESPAIAKPAVAAPSPTPPTPSASANASSLVATGDSRAPGLDKPSADPAQESDSESDPFSKNSISAVLHDGRLEVRGGRKIKTTRPHFLPGATGAFLANPNPILVLKISLDPSGAVKNVDIIRSSGSVEIDQPCRVAIYDWWFEPSHDKKGRPMSDVVLFTIGFR